MNKKVHSLADDEEIFVDTHPLLLGNKPRTNADNRVLGGFSGLYLAGAMSFQCKVGQSSDTASDRHWAIPSEETVPAPGKAPSSNQGNPPDSLFYCKLQ